MNRKATKSTASQLRHQVAIQRRTIAPDGMGGMSETWTTQSTVWAGVWPIKASERQEYATADVVATHFVKVRGETDVRDDGDDRVVFGDRTLSVLTVENPQERGVVKICTCEELRA